MSPFWFMIRWKFHDNTMLILFPDQLSAKNLRGKEHRTKRNHQHKQQHQKTAQRSEENGCQHRCQGQGGTTWDAPYQNHGKEPLTGTVNYTASRNSCHVAAKTHQKRAHAFSLQSQSFHSFIKHYRNTGHVPDIFNQCEYKRNAKHKSSHGNGKRQHIWQNHAYKLCKRFPHAKHIHQLFQKRCESTRNRKTKYHDR